MDCPVRTSGSDSSLGRDAAVARDRGKRRKKPSALQARLSKLPSMDDIPVLDDTTIKDLTPPCCDPFAGDRYEGQDYFVPLPATDLRGARRPMRPTWLRWAGPLMIAIMFVISGVGLFLSVR